MAKLMVGTSLILVIMIISSFTEVVSAEEKVIESRDLILLHSFKVHAVYCLEGGEIELDVNSSIPIDIYITTEDHYEQIKHTVFDGRICFHYFEKFENLTEERLNFRSSEDSNHYILIHNSGEHGDPRKYRTADVDITIHSEYGHSERTDHSHFLFLLLIPIGLIPAALWIRRKV